MPKPTEFRRRLPNVLTSLRVLLAAVLVVILSLWPGPRGSPDVLLLIAAGVFVLAAGTDALDGHLARKWKVVSIFGRIMDPFADKILVVGSFVLLAGPAFAVDGEDGGRVQASGIEPWMAVVVLSRELLVTSIRAVAEGAGKDFSAGVSGKAKMVVQSVAIPAILLTLALAGPGASGGPRILILVTAWATVAVTAFSAVPYITRGARALSERSEP